MTVRVYRLERKHQRTNMHWTLREKRLRPPFRKSYDSGRVDEWLETYADAGPPDELHFLGAGRGAEIDGLLTWRIVSWNTTLWLVDIRVRESKRGTGIGSALVDGLKGIAAQEEARGVFVETQINNHQAVRFYQSQGFEISGFNDHLYTNDDLEQQNIAIFLFLETDD